MLSFFRWVLFFIVLLVTILAGGLYIGHRMLVAQAQCEGLTLVTADPAVAAYDIRTIDASK